MKTNADHAVAFSRRDVLRVGALSLFGSAVTTRYAAGSENAGSKATKKRSCIFMLLQGGPSHIDLWDPKPDAPAEVRGAFKSIDTKTPGVRLGELLQETAKISGHLALVRSMTHRFNNHIAGTYIALTGSENQPNRDREADAKDFPGPGAVLNYLQQTPSAVPLSVSLPNWLSIPGPSNRMPGQYSGFLGATHDPFLISGDPNKPDFRPLSLTLPKEISPERVHSRKQLLDTLDQTVRDVEIASLRSRARFRRTAYELLTDPKVRKALDLTQEPAKNRDRYGRTKIGQSLLLSRRLVEAGVRMVSYNVFNQGWDHHGNIEKTLRGRVPPMEKAFAALVSDLAEREMLDDTLVINTGEFGRTPTINKGAGRDHWPNVYTSVMAGGGIRGGQVFGSSDSKGGEVGTDPVSPADLLATMWQQLGVDPGTMLHDRLNRPAHLSTGSVIRQLVS